jgi:hypothetical protein
VENRRLTIARIVATPAGQAFVLKQIADAEAGVYAGRTAGHFDRIIAQVEDPMMRRRVERHRDDEARHTKLYEECIARTGAAPMVVPTWMDKFDEAVGSPLSRPIVDRRGVFEAYLALMVIEERSLAQLPALEDAFRSIDPFISETIQAVAKDETRHIGYCHSITREYSPGDAEYDTTLTRFREIEHGCFVHHGAVSLRFMLDHGIIALDSE